MKKNNWIIIVLTLLLTSVVNSATISGTVRDQNGDPAFGNVRLYDPIGNYIDEVSTDGLGNFTSNLLNDGSYFAVTKYSNQLFDDVWDGVDGTQCMYELCGVVATGTAIVISGGVSVTGIDFILDPLVGSTISGHAQDDSNNPLVSLAINIYVSNGQQVVGIGTDDNGDYQTPILPDGSYYLRTGNEPLGLGTQFYNGINCLTNCFDPANILASTPVVIAGIDQTGINFSLSVPPGNIISGNLSDDVLMTNIPYAQMNLMDEFGGFIKNISSDQMGNYYFSGLSDGNYKVQVSYAEGFAEELYDNIPCVGGSCGPGSEGVIINLNNSDALNTDFALTYNGPGRIVGNVTRTDSGLPVSGLFNYFGVVFFDSLGNQVYGVNPDISGNYTIPINTPGDYYLVTDHDVAFHGLVNEYWNDIPCTTNCFDPVGQVATKITVNNGDTKIANFALDPTPSISGTIIAQSDNTPLQNILVCVVRRDTSLNLCNVTDVNGDYSVKGLPAEADLVAYINNTNGQPYILETYMDKGQYDYANGTGVDISVSNATGINFQLEYAHYISGVIKDESDNPTGEGRVNIWDQSGILVTTGYNDGSGNYQVDPLPSGTYFATAEAELWGRVSQLWQNISCPQEYCDLTNTGTPIVLNGTDVMNVDFNIIPQNAVATISGTLKDLNGDPTFGSVRFYDPYGNYVTEAGTDGNGVFITTMLPDGSYFAITKYTNLLFDDVWDGVDGTQCMYELCGVVATGTAIVISGGVSIAGIDFILDPLVGATLSGHAQDVGNNPLANLAINIYASNGQQAMGVGTDNNGDYQTPILPDGSYYLATTNEPLGLGTQFYNGINCLANCFDPANILASTPVVLTGIDQTGIDFTLSIPAGNIISGHLSDESLPSLNIQNANMNLYDSMGSYLKYTFTDNLGNYYFSGLTDGNYKVQVSYSQNYAEELYDNISCPGGLCDPSTEGTVINVNGSDVPNIDLALTYNGTPRITGVVSALNGGALLENIEVCVATRSGSTQRCTNSNANGVYSLEDIPSSTDLIPYIRSTNGQAYLKENFIDQAYQDWPNSTGVDVSVNSVANVNFQLEDGYFVSGIIRDATTSNLLDSVYVSILDSAGNNLGIGGSSDVSGNYTTSEALPAGSNYIARVSATGYIPQIWNNIDCFGSCDYLLAGLITLGPTNAVNIDFNLNAGGSISGVILDSVTNNPLEGVTVSIQNLDGSFYKSVATDASGIYSHENLPVEDYYLIANISTHFTQTYQNVNCLLGCNLAQDGTVVSIPNLTTDVSNIDFSLNTGGSINGVVTDTATGDPIVGAQVTVYFERGNYINAATTDASGNYSIGGLVQGSYYLETTTDNDMHLDIWYGGDVCQLRDKCIPNNSGNPVLISGLNASVNNVDFSLGIGGAITGQILLEDGNQWLGVTVGSGSLRAEIWDENRNLLRTGLQYSPYLDSYEVLGLAPGTYYVIFNSTTRNNDTTYPIRVDQALVDTAYGGLPCPRGSCDHTLTIPVEVSAGETVTGVGGALPWAPIVKGTLTDTVGNPISTSAFVFLHNDLGNYAAFGQVDSNGDWKLQTGLPNGTYYLSTFSHGRNNAGLNSYGNVNFVDELYNDIECAGGCEVTLGNPITMTSSVVTGLNMQVDMGGQISGKVLDASGGLPLVTVTAYDAVGDKVLQAITNLTGDYTISALPVGDYYLVTNNTFGLLNEVYDDILCEPFCNPTIGTPINIGSIGATVSTIDFVLNAAGSINGLVRDSGGILIAGVQVEVYNAIGVSVGSVISDVNGAFDIQNLPSGNYYVRTRNSINQVDALYQGMTCLGDACDVIAGTIVSVTSGMAPVSIDLQLQAELSFGGILTDEISTMPIVGTTIALYDAAGDFVANAVTDINGSYVFNGLLAGNYYVVTRNTPNYIDEAYNDIICNASCLASTGSIITLTSSRSDIDIQLSQGVSVFGQVVNNSNGVIGVRVQVFDGSGNQYSEGLTDIDGNYIIPQIPDGQFFLRTSNDTGYIDKVYSGFVCEGFCDVTTGTPIDITGSAVNVDFSLEVGGAISGNINDGINGVSSIPLEVYDTFENLIGTAVTDAIGDYRVSGLTPGSYAVKSVASNGYINQIYNNQTCAPEPCILVNSNLITVNTSEVMGIDFILKFGQSFNGTATDVFNNPLPLGTAMLYDSVDTPEIVMETPIVAGNWQFNGVANGNYYLLILNGSGLIDELYSEVGCPSGSCNIASLGTQISLTSAPVTQKNHVELKYASIELESIKATNGFDIVLDSGVDVFGTVQKNTSSPVAVDGATVFIMDTSGKVAGTGTSNALGEYESDASFPGGDYLVTALTDNQSGVNQGLIHELYDDIPCPFDCDLTSGNIVSFMASDPDQEINFILDSGSSISGTATVQGNNEALVSATIKLYDSSGMLVGQTQTGFDGSYQISGLPNGTYYAIILPVSSLYEDTLYGGLVCEQSCNVSTGTDIVLGVEELKTGIDFSLSIKEVIFASGFE